MNNHKTETDRNNELVYKQTIEMEKCFLGSLLSASEKIETRLEQNDFLTDTHKKIFETIYKLWDAGTAADIKTVSNELTGQVETSVISELTTITPSAANANYYESEVFRLSKARHSIKAATSFINTMQAETLTNGNMDIAIKNMVNAFSELTTARNETVIKTAAEILDMEFPAIHWIIPDLIGEGLTMIYGAPKIGKSWFILNLAIAAVAGGKFLGSLKTNKTKTLCLVLEDTYRRINSRLKQLGVKKSDVQGLEMTPKWQDGYMGLENYLKANPNIGLVIIDTLARFSNIQDFNEYGETTAAVARIKRIADDLGIAIVLIHHAKKTGKSKPTDWTENALGSTGLTGATDTTILIDREKREKSKAILHATGRDTADIKYNLKFDLDCGGWTITTKVQNSENTENKGEKTDYNWYEDQ